MIPADLATLPPGTILVDGPCLHVNGCRCGLGRGKNVARPTGHRRLFEAELCAMRARARVLASSR